MVFQANKID